MINWLIDKWIQRIWDKKEDHQVLAAYRDAKAWIALNPRYSLDSIKAECQERLDKYIIPQMHKRGLQRKLLRADKV